MANPNTTWTASPAANPSTDYKVVSLGQLGGNGNAFSIDYPALDICINALSINTQVTSWTESP